MSAAELHWLRSRLLGAKLKKAQSGQLRYRPPTGLVYDPAGQLVFDPDEQVQQAVHLLFSTFERWGPRAGRPARPRNHLSSHPALRGSATVNSQAPLATGASSHLITMYVGTYVMDEPRLRTTPCPMRARVSADARSPWRTGRVSCTTIIPVTSPGSNSSGTAPTREIAPPHPSIAGDHRGGRCSRGGCSAAGAGAHDHPLHEWPKIPMNAITPQGARREIVPITPWRSDR
jgi:hypothetical protein